MLKIFLEMMIKFFFNIRVISNKVTLYKRIRNRAQQQGSQKFFGAFGRLAANLENNVFFYLIISSFKFGDCYGRFQSFLNAYVKILECGFEDLPRINLLLFGEVYNFYFFRGFSTIVFI